MAKRLWDKGEGLNQKVHAFTVGNDTELDLEILPFDAIASAAHAKMLGKVELLTVEEVSQLVGALSEIEELGWEKKIPIPSELEDCHTTIEVELCKRLGDAGKKIHTGRSRNDQVMVAMRLYLRALILDSLQDLKKLSASLEVKIEQEFDTPIPGYTHMQHAMPTSLGIWLQSYYEHALSLIEDGLSLYHAINTNPLGVASGFGSSLKLDRDYVSELLGFRETQRNSIFVQSTRGREEKKYLFWLTDIASLIERIGVDLVLFATKEFSFVNLPEEFTTGSSIMPQKKNPDVLELLRAQAAKLRACAFELDAVCAKLPSNYHRDYQYTKEPVIKAAKLIGSALPILSEVIGGVSFNTKKLEQSMSAELYATYDAYQRVARGEAFRDAYVETARLVESGELNVKELRGCFDLIKDDSREEFKFSKTKLKKLNDQAESLKQE